MTGEFPVSNAGIAGAFDLIARAVQQFDATDTIAHRLSVVLDELCSNMIRHDETLSPDNNFTVDVIRDGDVIALTIIDPGQRFNPFEFSHDQTPEIGGQGISLVKGLCSSVDHSYESGRNKVKVTINLID